ncbi:MAG TPA: non-heme iron oxygenase ferredoxin subunit [Ktedonobacterales bacterium]|jgi:nitrite reductase/ring-hydroxylating ferredoxin subunit
MSSLDDVGAPFTLPFTLVARLSELAPGRLRRVVVGDRLILLAQVAGEVFAMDDDCTHISGPLDQGELCEYTLTCPLHLARFDIRDGRVLRGPARDALPTYAVRIVGDAVYVAAPTMLGE